MTSRTAILSYLTAHRDTFTSGEQLAQTLGLSRNAVWKAITSLRKDGYRIEAVTNRGYRLAALTSAVTGDAFRSELLAALPEGYPEEYIHIYPELVSTNRTAKEMAVSDAPGGTIVIAGVQSAGTGRFFRPFASPEGGLYMSLLFRPEAVRLTEPSLITVACANAVCRAIDSLTGFSVQIKWINDIYLNGKKICGILTESASGIESGEPEWYVIGIGINVSAKPEAFPESLREKAASLYPDGNVPFSLGTLAGAVITEVGGLLLSGDPDGLIGEYRSRLMMLGCTVSVIPKNDPDRAFSAKAVSVDEKGRLLIEKEDGTCEALSAGEISLTL